jgi:hypothetical protein
MNAGPLIAAALGLIVSSTAFAQAPADAPAGTTGLCKDGSYTAGANKRSACRGHKGVKDWYAADTAPTATTTATAAPAATPAGPPPSGSTGLCKDGSYTTGTNKRSACRGHKGIKDWYAGTTPAPAASESTPAAMPAQRATPPATPAAAPGGGAGQVWVNTNSHVYHCPGDRWYGKTKSGQYESEAQAKSEGDRPDHGKACS